MLREILHGEGRVARPFRGNGQEGLRGLFPGARSAVVHALVRGGLLCSCRWLLWWAALAAGRFPRGCWSCSVAAGGGWGAARASTRVVRAVDLRLEFVETGAQCVPLSARRLAGCSGCSGCCARYWTRAWRTMAAKGCPELPALGGELGRSTSRATGGS